MNEANIKFQTFTPESAKEPRIWVEHRPMLGLVLRPGSIEVGLRRSEMKKFTYNAGEIRLTPRLEKWFRTDNLHFFVDHNFGHCASGQPVREQTARLNCVAQITCLTRESTRLQQA